jgi:preprotein translocase subunit SecA
MINNLLTSVFGSRNERLLKQLSSQVKKINALEPEMQALSDEALKAKTEEFKARIAKGESLDKVLRCAARHPSGCSACAISTSS